MIFLASHIRFGHTTAIAAAIMCFSPDLVVVMIVIMRDHSYTSGYVSRLISDDIQLTTTDAKIYFRAVEWLSQWQREHIYRQYCYKIRVNTTKKNKTN